MVFAHTRFLYFFFTVFFFFLIIILALEVFVPDRTGIMCATRADIIAKFIPRRCGLSLLIFRSTPIGIAHAS